MNLAIGLAKKAAQVGEVPVGCVIIQDRDFQSGIPLEIPVVLAESHNTRENENNPVGHAELLAIHEASQKLGRWRLSGCTLYVTLEPCVMCAGAIVLSRLDRVVYGAVDPKAGAVKSLYEILADSRLNHRPEVLSSVLEEECSRLLKEFFSEKRAEKKK